MRQRLKAVRRALGMNQTVFAEHLGITQTAYSMIENGKRPLAEKYVKIICAVFHVSETWMIRGDGDMFDASPDEEEFTRIFSDLEPETPQYLLLMARELLNTQHKLLRPTREL